MKETIVKIRKNGKVVIRYCLRLPFDVNGEGNIFKCVADDLQAARRKAEVWMNKGYGLNI